MNPPRLGETLGRWRLVSSIRSGGMADVYLAEHTGPVRSAAAVKILYDKDNLKIWPEALALRTLAHPSIARYLDEGVTEDGHRYLAMEYVDGGSITAYADRMGLPLEERLLLFLDVCDAVSHAHQGMWRHLDLKPANILVTREGAVKVIDFGISRRPGVAPLPKTPGAASPVYASPQQVRGEEPQFTFDTYALGAVLYELLCGHPPFDPAKGSACVKELVLNEMPMAPSRAALQPRGTVSDGQVEKIPPFRAAMMRGGLTHNELHQALKGNLDAICLYGLRKEADRRYQDVGKLRADLHSVLNGGRPQIARSGERFYRALEALQRVPVAFIGVMLALSALWAHFALKRSYEAGRTNAIQERALTDRVANNSLRQLRDELRPSLQSHPATRHAISVVDAVIEAARAGLPAFNEGPDIQQWDRLRAKPLRSPNENFKEQQ